MKRWYEISEYEVHCSGCSGYMVLRTLKEAMEEAKKVQKEYPSSHVEVRENKHTFFDEV